MVQVIFVLTKTSVIRDAKKDLNGCLQNTYQPPTHPMHGASLHHWLNVKPEVWDPGCGCALYTPICILLTTVHVYQRNIPMMWR